MIPGSDFQEITTAITQAYDRDDLEDVLRRRLDVRLDLIVPPARFSKVVFDLVSWSERQGRIVELIRVTAQERPHNTDMERVYQKFVLAEVVKVQDGGRPPAADASAGTPGGLERLIRPKLASFDMAIWSGRMIRIEGQVCRVLVNGKPQGTGFLVGPDTILTNYHVLGPVLKNEVAPSAVKCQFDYKVMQETPTSGLAVDLHASDWLIDASPITNAEAQGKPEGSLPTGDELDFALIRLARGVGGEKPDAAAGATAAIRGWIMVPDTDTQYQTGMPVLIAQHPSGRPLELALDTDAIIGLNGNGTRVRYATNTERGSSGSPCFGLDWTLIALHHYGDPVYDHPKFNQGIPIHLIRDRLRRMGRATALGSNAG
jgi:Trypsin-like peptidase domain/Effector-associated domain 1